MRVSDTAAQRIDHRSRLLAATAAADITGVAAAARALLLEQGTIREASFIRKSVDAVPRSCGTPFRVALLSSFSIEFLHDPLAAYGLTEGLRIDVYTAGFNQFRQEILSPSSALYRFAPDAVILAVEGEALAPVLYDGYPLVGGGTEAEIVGAVETEVRTLVEAFRSRSAAPLLVHDLAPPRRRTLGILDGHEGPGQAALTAEINNRLRDLARRHHAVYIVDYAGLVAAAGAEQWYDERMAHYAKAPIAQAMLGRLAREYLKFFRALSGRTRKCLVLDLDNTLWGGVLGEEGPDGIKFGGTYPGSAYREFQQTILNLHRRGVLLAIASKNNRADVDELFAVRSDMVLSLGHFSAIEIHWGAKDDSIRRISEALNIGLGHMVFVDDNPAECERVREALPMVTVMELPTRPEAFAAALLQDGFFDGLTVSNEDLRRTDLYAQRDQAEALRRTTSSVEDYYRRLAMTVEIASVDAASLPRAAQLTQKTNQFNATTFRLAEPEIALRVANPQWEVAVVRVVDTFGDNGIVGLTMAQTIDKALAIETLLLSCRVIGRTVETAMLAHLARRARARGLERLLGRIVPTPKNAPVRDVYERHGFRRRSTDAAGATEWEFDLTAGGITDPEWLTIVDGG